MKITWFFWICVSFSLQAFIRADTTPENGITSTTPAITPSSEESEDAKDSTNPTEKTDDSKETTRPSTEKPKEEKEATSAISATTDKSTSSGNAKETVTCIKTKETSTPNPSSIDKKEDATTSNLYDFDTDKKKRELREEIDSQRAKIAAKQIEVDKARKQADESKRKLEEKKQSGQPWNNENSKAYDDEMIYFHLKITLTSLQMKLDTLTKQYNNL